MKAKTKNKKVMVIHLTQLQQLGLFPPALERSLSASSWNKDSRDHNVPTPGYQTLNRILLCWTGSHNIPGYSPASGPLLLGLPSCNFMTSKNKSKYIKMLSHNSTVSRYVATVSFTWSMLRILAIGIRSTICTPHGVFQMDMNHEQSAFSISDMLHRHSQLVFQNCHDKPRKSTSHPTTPFLGHFSLYPCYVSSPLKVTESAMLCEKKKYGSPGSNILLEKTLTQNH